MYPGDIGYDDEHTWMILGQCKDKSAVILHSTPNAGVQISGTPTPDGNYGSQAIALQKSIWNVSRGIRKCRRPTVASTIFHQELMSVEEITSDGILPP